MELGRIWVGDKEGLTSDEGEASSCSSGIREMTGEGIDVGSEVSGATFLV